MEAIRSLFDLFVKKISATPFNLQAYQGITYDEFKTCNIITTVRVAQNNEH